MKRLVDVDPEIAKVIRLETERQGSKLELIASENFVSEAVLEAMGSPLTNKYAEGYPGKRYYGGCEFVDMAETLAIERAKQLFGADHVNVQPHSGAQANMAAYFAVLEHGDTILGLNLAHGGHLTHGSPVNFSGRFFKVIPYGVDQKTEQIDMAEVRRLAKEHRPKLIVTGGSAYPRTLHFDKFKEIADEVGCLLMADIAHPAGIIAAGLHPSPDPLLRPGHHHDPQDPARPARRDDHVQGGAGGRGQQEHLPRDAGRPADARHRGQGGGVQGGARPGVQGVPAADPRQRQGAGRGA